MHEDPAARRFGGIARLYGQAALERFFRSRVCVFPFSPRRAARCAGGRSVRAAR